jgi:hypothetical protein
MLVLATLRSLQSSSAPARLDVHPVLALAPHLLLALSVISSTAWLAWVHARAARRRKGSSSAVNNGTASHQEERQPLLGGEHTSDGTSGEEKHEGFTGWELLLGAVKVLNAVALVGVAVGKLQGVELGESTRWTRVFEGGTMAVPVRRAFCCDTSPLETDSCCARMPTWSWGARQYWPTVVSDNSFVLSKPC